MSHEQFHAAVVAFLDQFIARGTKDDVPRLRESLVANGEFQLRLDRQLPSSDDVSERDGFEAMHRFLEDVAPELQASGDGPDVWELISWTEMRSDSRPWDPAQWDDWVQAVASAARN